MIWLLRNVRVDPSDFFGHRVVSDWRRCESVKWSGAAFSVAIPYGYAGQSAYGQSQPVEAVAMRVRQPLRDVVQE